MLKRNYKSLSGGVENEVRCISQNDSKQVIKIYNEERYRFDGNSLMRKYRIMQESNIINDIFSDITIVNERRTPNDKNYISYNYIPGKIRWKLSEEDIQKIAKVSVTINNLAADALKTFKYDIVSKFNEAMNELLKMPKSKLINNLIDCLLENKAKIFKIVKFDNFCHGDFHPGNILWNEKEISGIIDWDNCCYGPSEVDVANMRFDLAIIYGIESAQKYLTEVEECLAKKLPNIYYYDLLTICFGIDKYKKWIIPILEELNIDAKTAEKNINDFSNLVMKKINHLNNSSENIIIDIHNGGPIIYNDYLIKKAQHYLNKNYDIGRLIRNINYDRLVALLSGKYPEYVAAWNESGVDIAIRTIGVYGNPSFSIESIMYDLSLVQYLDTHSDWIGIVHNFEELKKFVKNKKKGYILSIESLECFENNIERLEMLKQLGISIAQLTYNYGNYIGSGCYDIVDTGLTKEGKKVVRKLNDLNILIDLSHVSNKTSLDVLKVTKKPVICTHTFSYELNNNNRGKTDEFFHKLKSNEGFVGVTVNPNLIGNTNSSIIDTMVQHIEHIINIVGVDNVGIGTDWDGPMPDFLVKDLNKEAKKVQCKDYDLNEKTQDYNSMKDWKNIVTAIKNKFGNELAAKILGNNFYEFLKRNNF